MEPKNAAGAPPFPRVPTVIFANWRELLNRVAQRRRIERGGRPGTPAPGWTHHASPLESPGWAGSSARPSTGRRLARERGAGRSMAGLTYLVISKITLAIGLDTAGHFGGRCHSEGAVPGGNGKGGPCAPERRAERPAFPPGRMTPAKGPRMARTGPRFGPTIRVTDGRQPPLASGLSLSRTAASRSVHPLVR